MHPIKISAIAWIITLSAGGTVMAGQHGDSRTMIKIPADIKQKMLVNMRDHIGALDDIIHAVQAGEYEKAEDIAENRLGWSSLVKRGDQEVANHWARPMQKMADQMYRSATDFVIVSQNASVEESAESYRKVLEALGKVTNSCRGCHEAYRVR